MSAISFCLFAAVVSQEIRMPLLVQATCTTPIVPMHANGKAALVYEIQFTNYEKTPVDLETITATTGDKRILLSLSGAPLKDTLVPASEHEGDVSVIAPGETVVAYLWAETDPNSIPKSFTHRFDFKKLGTRQTWIEGLELKPNTTKLRNIDPPLEGSRWIAVNGPGNDTAHRRARFAMDGRCVIGQRFAIDYIMVGDDGKTFIGPADKNESYHCFGKNVLAVADATVVTSYQGVPINTPGHGMEIPMTVQTLPGNHVILDLGGGLYAGYAHMIDGSLKVKAGQKVKRGEVLGLVGNSGNSGEPHLHFQLMNAPDIVRSEGFPYIQDSSTYHSTVAEGTGLQFRITGLPKKLERAMPTENQCINFLK